GGRCGWWRMTEGSDPAPSGPVPVVRPRSARPASTTREDRRRHGDVVRPPERLAIRARLGDNDAEQRLESFPRQAARLVATRSLQEGKSPGTTSLPPRPSSAARDAGPRPWHGPPGNLPAL